MFFLEKKIGTFWVNISKFVKNDRYIAISRDIERHIAIYRDISRYISIYRGILAIYLTISQFFFSIFGKNDPNISSIYRDISAIYQNISLKIRYIAVFCDISWDFCISIFLIISKVDISMEIYRHLEIYRRHICYFDMFKHIIFCDISINKRYFLNISKIYRKDINNIPKIKYFFQNIKILIYHQISFL